MSIIPVENAKAWLDRLPKDQKSWTETNWMIFISAHHSLSAQPTEEHSQEEIIRIWEEVQQELDHATPAELVKIYEEKSKTFHTEDLKEHVQAFYAGSFCMTKNTYGPGELKTMYALAKEMGITE